MNPDQLNQQDAGPPTDGVGKEHPRGRLEIILGGESRGWRGAALYSVAMDAPRRVRVAETFRSIFYAPLSVAIHGGHFAAEGLDVDVVTAKFGAGTVGMMTKGEADVALSGLMRSFDQADRGEAPLVHFAGVNDRNGFFLLSREPRPSFGWSDLVGRTVISFGGAPTPWLCMQSVLRRHGVDPARIAFLRGLSTADAVAAFHARKGDFIEHGPPIVDQLLADGTGHLVAAMGDATGPVPFSSFMATRETLTRDRERMLRFVRGLARAQRWIAASGAGEIAAVIAPAFPDIDARIRAAAVERYVRQSTWARDPVLTRSGFDTLQTILLSGGFIRRAHRFEDLVDVEIARQAVGY
jgi:NitT/TauT family transport system substrate-binding protein